MSTNNIPKDTDAVILNGINFTHLDIFNVVDEFYTRIQNDPILKVPFQSVHDWPEHVKRLTNFWWMKFGGTPYLFAQYDPVTKHFFAGFNEELLSRWLSIFHDVLKEKLQPAQYEIWKTISNRMGQGLTFKNELFRQAYEENK